MRVDVEIATRLAAETRRGRTITKEIPRHPIVFPTRETLHGFAIIAPQQGRAAFPGRPDQPDRKPWLEGQRDQRSLAVSGDAFDPHLSRIHGGIGLEVIEAA